MASQISQNIDNRLNMMSCVQFIWLVDKVGWQNKVVVIVVKSAVVHQNQAAMDFQQ